jgi:hypothetical protein
VASAGRSTWLVKMVGFFLGSAAPRDLNSVLLRSGNVPESDKTRVS